MKRQMPRRYEWACCPDPKRRMTIGFNPRKPVEFDHVNACWQDFNTTRRSAWMEAAILCSVSLLITAVLWTVVMLT